MKRLLFALVIVLSARQGFAQSHRDVVADVVNDLRARGVDISGPCGALAIVKRVAWRLRAEGAGLLFKNSGNNCEERAVDIIVYPDGHGFDVLTGSGDPNGNGPDWSAVPIESGASRWRGVAVDPDGGLTPQPPPIATPPPVVIPPPVVVPPPVLNLDPVLQRIAELESEMNHRFDKSDQEIADFREAVRSKWAAAMTFAGKYLLPPIAAALGAWQMTK